MCQKPCSRLVYRGQGLCLLLEPDFSDVAHHIFALASDHLLISELYHALIEVSTYELTPGCLSTAVLCFSALDPVKERSLKAVEVVQFLVCCPFQVRSFH